MASIIRGSDSFDTANLGLTSGSKTTNGYAYLPNGLIIQWGKITANASTKTFTFPIAFPNACFNVSATYELLGHSGGIGEAPAISSISTSSTTISVYTAASSVYITVIGY